MDISNITVNTQSSILIDFGKKIYIDPIEIADATHDADYIFITHDHSDHYSMPNIHKILDNKTVFIIPVPLEMSVRRSTPVGSQICVIPGQRYETSDFTFETVPSYNLTKSFHPKSAGWCGYIITLDGVRIYVAGDTDATNEAGEVKCDIALVPIGGTFTMNYKEAAELINKMKPKYVIPTHYGSYVGDISDGEEFSKLVDEDIKVELKL